MCVTDVVVFQSSSLLLKKSKMSPIFQSQSSLVGAVGGWGVGMGGF